MRVSHVTWGQSTEAPKQEGTPRPACDGGMWNVSMQWAEASKGVSAGLRTEREVGAPSKMVSEAAATQVILKQIPDMIELIQGHSK